jgi:hypothetical protein
LPGIAADPEGRLESLSTRNLRRRNLIRPPAELPSIDGMPGLTALTGNGPHGAASSTLDFIAK